MHDRELYARILGIQSPWRVTEVALRLEAGEVEVAVSVADGLTCPTCGAAAPGYDHRERRWRHLDTCQYRTIIVAQVPRVQCAEHGIGQVAVPWAEAASRFTALFEALVIDWLRAASIAAVSRRLQLSWDAVDGIMRRAVARGLARRPAMAPRRIGIDETSFQKRHEYVTIVSDLESSDVLTVADDRTEGSLAQCYEQLGPGVCAQLEVVAMDMSRPYIAATRRCVPDAEQRIAFDKFHVAQQLSHAVDLVRRAEHRALRAEGEDALSGTRYWWLINPSRMDRQQRKAFQPLRDSVLKTARAWAIKELAGKLWNYTTRGWAAKAWEAWLAWALRCRLEPIRKVAETVRKYLWGILNAVVTHTTNARAEGINSRIQELKRRACGYRNRDRFRTVIYFHLGGLDLYPATHSFA